MFLYVLLGLQFVLAIDTEGINVILFLVIPALAVEYVVGA